MPNIGPFELIIILAIVILLFGVGRIRKVSGELGGAISEFRKGLNDNQNEASEGEEAETKA